MVKQSLPAVSTVTKENLEEFKTMDKVVIIGYIAAEDKASNETFTALAESKRDDYLFAVTSDPTLAKTEGVKQPSIVLYKDFDEKKDVFDGKFDKEAIISWIKTASTPLVGEIGPETYAGYMSVCIHSTSFFLSQKLPLTYVKFNIGRNSSGVYLCGNAGGAAKVCRRLQAYCGEAQGCYQHCHY